MKPTFEETGDVLPEGRIKYIHGVGLVAKVKFVPNSKNPYSGVLKGFNNGIIRLSLAKPADQSKKSA